MNRFLIFVPAKIFVTTLQSLLDLFLFLLKELGLFIKIPSMNKSDFVPNSYFLWFSMDPKMQTTEENNEQALALNKILPMI